MKKALLTYDEIVKAVENAKITYKRHLIIPYKLPEEITEKLTNVNKYFVRDCDVGSKTQIMWNGEYTKIMEDVKSSQ